MQTPKIKMVKVLHRETYCKECFRVLQDCITAPLALTLRTII
jgi:hypothetical protein